jgi:hypothetical protein
MGNFFVDDIAAELPWRKKSKNSGEESGLAAL